MEKARVKGRIHGTLTAAQKRRMARVRTQIAEELPDLVHRNKLARDARKEKTFSGVLRRAIHAFPQSPMKVAATSAIRWVDLEAFLTGEKTLPSDAIDRLVKTLKLRIPAKNARTAKAS